MKDISLALVIGQSIGTYSSIFIAAPSLVALNRNGFRQKRPFVNNDSMSLEKSLKVDVEAVKYDAIFENLCFLELSDKQIPVFFTSFFNNTKVWDQLWIESQIPQTLEECGRVIKKKLSDRLLGSSYYFLSNIEQNQMWGIYKITADLVNSEVTLELITVGHEDAIAPENDYASLTDHFHRKGFYKVTYLLPVNATLHQNSHFSTMNQEGVLRKVRLTRTGERVDLLIYSSFSE